MSILPHDGDSASPHKKYQVFGLSFGDRGCAKGVKIFFHKIFNENMTRWNVAIATGLIRIHHKKCMI